MRNHCSLVFTGELSLQGFSGGAKWILCIHSIKTFFTLRVITPPMHMPGPSNGEPRPIYQGPNGKQPVRAQKQSIDPWSSGFPSTCRTFPTQWLGITCCPRGIKDRQAGVLSPRHSSELSVLPRVSMPLKKWVHDPIILGNDQPFLKGHGDSR